MGEFAAFVLTKNNIYYLKNSEFHEDIIENFQLKDNDINLVRVIMIPPNNHGNVVNADKWIFRSCQDVYPDWTYFKDPTIEEITRNALIKRIQEQKIGTNLISGIGAIITAGAFSHVEVGNSGQAIVGYYGIAISGNEGYSLTGNYGKAISGEKGLSTAGHCGFAKVGNFGIAISLLCGSSIAGNFGKAVSGNHGKSIVGDNGEAISGDNGRVQAGKDGEIQIKHWNGIKYRTIIGYVGEGGIEPDTLYKVENGLFVRSD
jgi:hypothetical protein